MLRAGQVQSECVECPSQASPRCWGRTPQGSALLRMALMRRSGSIVERPFDEHLRSVLPPGNAPPGSDERTDLEVPITSLRELACENRYHKPPMSLPKSRLSRTTPLRKRGRGSCSENYESELPCAQRFRFHAECKVPYMDHSQYILEEPFSAMDGIDCPVSEPDDMVVPETKQLFSSVDCRFYPWQGQTAFSKCVPIEMEA